MLTSGQKKLAGGIPATAVRRGWFPTNRKMGNEIYIFRQLLGL